eukprot:PhF_6_TR11516/c0_g1_i3/m.18433
MLRVILQRTNQLTARGELDSPGTCSNILSSLTSLTLTNNAAFSSLLQRTLQLHHHQPTDWALGELCHAAVLVDKAEKVAPRTLRHHRRTTSSVSVFRHTLEKRIAAELPNVINVLPSITLTNIASNHLNLRSVVTLMDRRNITTSEIDSLFAAATVLLSDTTIQELTYFVRFVNMKKWVVPCDAVYAISARAAELSRWCTPQNAIRLMQYHSRNLPFLSMAVKELLSCATSQIDALLPADAVRLLYLLTLPPLRNSTESAAWYPKVLRVCVQSTSAVREWSPTLISLTHVA